MSRTYNLFDHRSPAESLEAHTTTAQALADQTQAPVAVGRLRDQASNDSKLVVCAERDVSNPAYISEVIKVVQPRVSVAGIVQFLEGARSRGLKFPKLWLQLPDGSDLRVTIAGDQSRTPGYIMLTDGGAYPDNKYFGRISPAGKFEVGRDGNAIVTVLNDLLAKLADKPAEVAAAYGHLTGHCCFCSLPLTDARSVHVGYGAKCADRFGLPWGDVQPASAVTLKQLAEETAMATISPKRKRRK